MFIFNTIVGVNGGEIHLALSFIKEIFPNGSRKEEKERSDSARFRCYC
jgi:hypothetical protein